MTGQSTRGGDHRNAFFFQPVDKIFDEIRAAAGHFLLGHFTQANCHGFDLFGGHTTVRSETFIHRQPGEDLVVEFLVVGGDQSAAYCRAFAAGHVENIHIFHQIFQDLFDRAAVITFFTALDEVRVFRDQTAVKYQRDLMFGRKVFDLTQVVEREWLPANKVGGGFHTHIGDLFRAIGLYGFFEFLQIEVAFEWFVTIGDQRVIGEYFEYLAAHLLHMRF